MNSMNSNAASDMSSRSWMSINPPAQGELNSVGTPLVNPEGVVNSERLSSKETVQTEVAAHPEKIKKDPVNFIKNGLSSFRENRGDLATASLAIAAVTMSPLILPPVLMISLGAKVIKEINRANLSLKDFAKAGLLVGSLGLVGVASSLYLMKNSSKSSKDDTVATPKREVLKQSSEKKLEEMKSSNEHEKAIAKKIYTLRDMAMNGTEEPADIKERQINRFNELKEKVSQNLISKDFAKEALKEIKKATKDLKLAPANKQKLLDNTVNNHRRVLERSIDFNNSVLSLFNHLNEESKAELGDIGEIIRQEHTLKDNLNNLQNNPETTLGEKLNEVQKFKGATNNEANLKTLDNLTRILSKNRSPEEISDIKTHIRVLKQYLDLETNGKLREHSTDEEWANFENQEKLLNLAKATAYVALLGYATST